MNTVHKARLESFYKDWSGYVNYVFRIYPISGPPRLLSCSKYPNWNTPPIKIGSWGYVEYKEVKAGEDTWWDGKSNIAYRYDNVYFIKFVPLKPKIEKEFIT